MAAMKAVVREYQESQFEPSLEHWKKGELDVSDAWSLVGMDITCHNVVYYLAIVVLAGFNHHN